MVILCGLVFFFSIWMYNAVIDCNRNLSKKQRIFSFSSVLFSWLNTEEKYKLIYYHFLDFVPFQHLLYNIRSLLKCPILLLETFILFIFVCGYIDSPIHHIEVCIRGQCAVTVSFFLQPLYHGESSTGYQISALGLYPLSHLTGLKHCKFFTLSAILHYHEVVISSFMGYQHLWLPTYDGY